ncbi:hypothetical protein [Dyella psychrodurans]|uniref:Uncharacterized protein n=1 Tax=Dyella psychrodurans TaxID=1927960 RepID=A0A370XBU9_9GAMM|nr:hypothetical protein [Dyella psychrodurans]RDS85878.1 hypothetical protein DWU99_00970 [Dyella psychrodurans]
MTLRRWEPTADQAQRIRRLREEGAAHAHIAAAIGVGEGTVGAWMKRQGLTPTPRSERRFPPALRALIHENLVAGKEAAAIARALRLTISLVWSQAQAEGVIPPGSRPFSRIPALTPEERRTLRRALERPIRIMEAARSLDTTVRVLKARLAATGTTLVREQRQALLERIDGDLRAGRTIPEIANDLGRPERAVVRWANTAGWAWPRIAPQILRWHEQGATVEVIAPAVDRDIKVVRAVLIHYGHTPRTTKTSRNAQPAPNDPSG